MIFVGLLFGAIVAEVGLRMVGYSYPIWYQNDPERGYSLIPNVEGWFWVENTNYVKINDQGFRDRSHQKEKPANTYRVAIIGDSFAEARQVALQDAFCSVTERELQAKAPPGRTIEVLNFGVGGYGTAAELLTLRQRVWDYSPDAVVLAFTTYNDVRDNYRPFKNADELVYFQLENGGLVLDDSFRSSKKYKQHDSAWFKAWVLVHNSSRLVQLLHHAQFALRTRISDWKERRRLAEVQEKARSNDGGTDAAPQNSISLTDLVGLDNMIYREPEDEDWRKAWDLSEALITQVRDESVIHGAQFMMVVVTTDIQVYPDAAVRKGLMERVGVTDLFHPNRRLRSFAEREGIAFVDLAEPMQEAADRDKVFFHGFGNEIGSGHWNEAGHKFAGELMAAKLAEMIPN